MYQKASMRYALRIIVASVVHCVSLPYLSPFTLLLLHAPASLLAPDVGSEHNSDSVAREVVCPSHYVLSKATINAASRSSRVMDG